MTILGFGSLLSERSSRLTFPDLKNFRLGRLRNYRRVFAHPTALFFRRGIADLSTLQIGTLSVEPCPGHDCIVTVFQVPNKDMLEDGIPSQLFLEREPEYDIVLESYEELGQQQQEEGHGAESSSAAQRSANNKMGILCRRSTDEAYLERWGAAHFEESYGKYGVTTIWNWSADSGLRPCAVYLRHCYLAAQAMGDECFASFLDDTFLVDRKTTIRHYVQQYPEVLQVEPPPELEQRYGG